MMAPRVRCNFVSTTGDVMMLPAAFNLPYLGERTYLHGTTLFMHLCTYVESPENVSFSLRHVLKTDRIRVSLGSGGAASFSCIQQSRRAVALQVDPLPFSGSPHRVAWDETLITCGSVINAKSRSLEQGALPETPFVPAMVALNKHLLLQTMPGKGPGQWLFVKLEASRIPNTFCGGALVVENVLGGKLVATALNDACGVRCKIYFAWQPYA